VGVPVFRLDFSTFTSGAGAAQMLFAAADSLSIDARFGGNGAKTA